jgi:hypothetical protein
MLASVMESISAFSIQDDSGPMTKTVFPNVSPARSGETQPPPTADRPSLVEFLKSLDLAGLELTRERDLGRD